VNLQKRLDQIEARLTEARAGIGTPPTAPARQPAAGPRPPRPTTVEPPFPAAGHFSTCWGAPVERFLSIAPADSRSLASVRVLRPGETEGGCKLESLDGGTAPFCSTGQVAVRFEACP